MAQDEAAIIRKRFLTQTTGAIKDALPPFARLVKKYTHFCQAVDQGSLDEATKLHNEVMIEVYQMHMYLRRLDASASASTKEQEFYAREQEHLQQAIEKAKADIEQRKSELDEARKQLAQQQEYEALKAQVVKVPARSTTRLEMSAVEKEIADLQQQCTDLEQQMQRRKVQFRGIVHCIEQAYCSIDGENQEEGGEGEVAGEGVQAMQVG